MKKYQTIGIVTLITLITSGCNNNLLNQAKSLSENSKSLKESFNILASDYVESCYRRANYGLLTTDISQDVFKQKNLLLKACNTTLEGSKSTSVETKVLFVIQNTIISNYLDAIASISRDETFSFGQEAGKIKGVFEKAGLPLSEAKGTAFTAVVGFILKSITQNIASNSLKKEVPKVNLPLQKSICFLKKDFDNVYRRALNQEQKQLDEYYKSTIIIMLKRSRNEFELESLNIQKLRKNLYNEPPSKTQLLVQFSALPEVYHFYDEWRNKQVILRQRYDALDQYLDILDTIGSGHAALDKAAKGEGLDQAKFNSECNPIVKDDTLSKEKINQKTEFKKALVYLSSLDKKVIDLRNNKFVKNSIIRSH